MMSDGRRAMSSDSARNVHVWLVDSGIVLHSTTVPSTSIDVTLNMKFAVSFTCYFKSNLRHKLVKKKTELNNFQGSTFMF